MTFGLAGVWSPVRSIRPDGPPWGGTGSACLAITRGLVRRRRDAGACRKTARAETACGCSIAAKIADDLAQAPLPFVWRGRTRCPRRPCIPSSASHELCPTIRTGNPVKILEYTGLDTSRVRASSRTVQDAIARNDFRAAQVEKLASLRQGKFYRARLDEADLHRRQAGGHSLPAGATGRAWLHRQRQDCADPRKAKTRRRRSAVRHALGLPRAERQRPPLRQRFRAFRSGGAVPFLSRVRRADSRCSGPRSRLARLCGLVCADATGVPGIRRPSNLRGDTRRADHRHRRSFLA